MSTTVKSSLVRLPLYASASKCLHGIIDRKDIGSLATYNIGSNASTIVQGDNIADWKDRIKRGANATTSLSVYATKLTKWTPGSAFFQKTCTRCNGNPLTEYAYYTDYLVGHITQGFNSLPNGGFASTLLDDADYQAKMAFIKKVTKVHRRMMGGEFLGDLMETLHMIRSPAKELRHAIAHYVDHVKKRGRRVLPVHRRKFLADTWLEAQFGWLPLMSDVEDGARALAEWHRRQGLRPTTIWISGKGSAGPILESSSFSPSNVVSGTIAITSRINTEVSGNVRYYGKLEVSNASTAGDLVSLFGLTPTLENFAPTAWELIPYSFLVDYFTNIGDIINARSVNLSGLKWVTKTSYQERRKYIAYCAPSKTFYESQSSQCKGRILSFSAEEGEAKQVVIQRNPYPIGSLSVFPFRFQLPGLGLKWLNIAALRDGRLRKPFY